MRGRRGLAAGLVALLAACLLALAGCASEESRPPPPDAKADPKAYPQTALIYLFHDPPDLELAARYDLLVIDMEWAHRAPAALRELRRENPRMKIFAYMGSEEILTPQTLAGVTDYFGFRKEIAAGIEDDWWLLDGDGDHASFFPDTWMLNPTTGWSDYLARFMVRRVLSTGLFDGIYYDNAWASPSWLGDLGEAGIDLDRDGRSDQEEHGREWVAERWDDGMARLFAATAELAPDAVLMGNGSAATYENWGADYSPRHHEWLSGALDEHWPTLNRSWSAAIDRVHGWLDRATEPAFFIIQADPPGRPNDPLADLRGFRFTFGSALLTGAHFAYNRGDHGQTWWYDEYDGGGLGRGYLGRAAGPPERLADGLYRREFANGLVVVNPTDEERTVTLAGGPWRLIEGTQAPEVNTGQVVESLDLAPQDARVLVRAD